MAKEIKKNVDAMAGQDAAAAEAAAVKVQKKKDKPSQKERPRSKKKHAKIQVWKLYDAKGGKLVRKRETCPRCGPGTFLATYKNRKYCGKCGYGIVQQPMQSKQ